MKEMIASGYSATQTKREIQSKWFPLIKQESACVLGGPDLKYLNLYPDNIKEIYVYEKDERVHNMQFEQVLAGVDKRVKALVNLDIIRAPADIKTFFEFDFCDTIKNKDISKYKDCAFMCTFCVRDYGRDETLLTLVDMLGETPVETTATDDPNYYQLRTNKNIYLHRTYNHPPMITILKIS